MTLSYIETVKNMLARPAIQWMAMAGIQAEIVEPRHIKLRMPIEGLHTNHVGTAYAGSIFSLAELSGGAFIQSAYGFDEFVPVVKSSLIKYIKPGLTPLTCEISMSEQEAEERLRPVRERGRGNYPLTISVTDENGNQIAEADFIYYLLPVPSGK